MTVKAVEERMKRLGTYREEYAETVHTYVSIGNQLAKYERQWRKEGCPAMTETKQGLKKHPLISVMESLRRDKLRYENELGLTPAAQKTQKAGNDAGKKEKRGLVLIGGMK